MTTAIPAPRRLSLLGDAPDDTRVHLADHLPEELPDVLAPHGITIHDGQARRIFSAIVQRGEAFEQIDTIPMTLRKRLAEVCAVPTLGVKERRLSPTDGFLKYLWSLPDGREVESVRIPIPCEPPDTAQGEAIREKVVGEWKGRKKKYVVCVSSQVGCALGCSFCATATLGFTRNLRSSEIIAQLMAVRAEADRPVRGVVFMGMGEPFLNYESVVRAAQVASHPCGLAIAAKDITISTAGIVPAIRRYTADGHKFRLAISFTSARPEMRRVLMPIERKYPTDELVAALKDHAEKSRDRITVAYVMIGGEGGNLTEADAIALGEKFREVPIRLDLIDVNGNVGGYRPPDEAEVTRFRGWLATYLRQPFARRYSGGKDVDAACGMLAAKRGAESAVGA